MDEAEVVEHFFGVYLLYSMNVSYKSRTYIGFTVNPTRRIKQHNAGKDKGGARKTSDKGPWNMVLIVHGFPNKVSALRFEWAWQHPHISRRLKHVFKKKPRRNTFEYCLMVLTEMLKVGPWHRLALTIRWLDYEFFEKYSNHVSAPLHMPMCCGKVTSSKKTKNHTDNSDAQQEVDKSVVLCTICKRVLDEEEGISCIRPSCVLQAHLICLAEKFSQDEMIIPIEGVCPSCNTNVLWGELIKKKIGCYGDISEHSDSDE